VTDCPVQANRIADRNPPTYDKLVLKHTVILLVVANRIAFENQRRRHRSRPPRHFHRQWAGSRAKDRSKHSNDSLSGQIAGGSLADFLHGSEDCAYLAASRLLLFYFIVDRSE
jgi:hypothetical protein